MGIVADTLEVRWFYPGPVPEIATDWFLDAPEPAITESRTDAYLDVPGRDDLGVKVRAGSLLELKWRTGIRARPGLAEGFDGRVESWTKWGFSLQPMETVSGVGLREWLSVEKTRRSRFYEVSGDEGTIQGLATSGLPTGSGCAAELVEVRVGTEVAWGVGFEAFGTAPDLLAVLIAGMEAFAADTPLGTLEFGIRDSYSYPAFLSRWPPR